jgi:nucleotide-binding universal stress UspA family protein
MSSAASDIRRILVPDDFSATARHAMDYALDLARRLGASVCVLHAYEVPVYGFPEGAALTADLAGQIREASNAALDSIVTAARKTGVEVDSMLRQGPAWSEIQAAANEWKADLIVIGTHGRRGLSRALLGSVAEKVVRTAPCPVLTVHGPAGEA